MATDLTVILEDRPGTLAELGETLGNAGINVLGGCGFPCQGKGVIHVLVEDGLAAGGVLENAGFELGDSRQVLEVEFEDRPGEGGKIYRRLADVGINVDLLYLSTTGKLILGVDDMAKARAAL